MTQRVVAAFALAALATGCGSSRDEPAYTTATVNGLRLPARVQGTTLATATEDGWDPRFWPGVNLGATIPGRQPGEVAPTRADYDRWLEGIGELGARVVRVYTILRPSFYDALAAYNEAHQDRPLFVIHGVWIPEEEWLESQDAYTATVTDGFDAEIEDAVAVVHGDAEIPEVPGHADGAYDTDVSRWLLGWSIGIEWDPEAVAATDEKHAGLDPYHGMFITASDDATPMERWIAARLDHLAGLEAGRGWSRPLTFTNWITLDPLDHPYDPLEEEDLVSLDATHIAATDRWPGGFFASYHAYPYYPDFLRLTPEYQTYERASDGEVDPYSGYLHTLREYHGDQAVMITEFGVPSGIGVAHLGPLGRDQGNHSEQEQGEIDAQLLRNIEEEGYAGGILFQWVDEWFKPTWNTVDLEVPSDRRQLWRNDLTNEEQFGIVAAEPGTTPAVTLDGDGSEWEDNGSHVIAESAGPVREVRAVSDAQSLWLRLVLDDEAVLDEGKVVVGLDVRPGENRGLPGLPGTCPEADVALELGPGEVAKLSQAAWWEPTRIRYGEGLGYMDVDPPDLEPGSGVWVSPLQILNKPYVVPATGESRLAELHDLGEPIWGSAEDDNRALVASSGTTVEVRLPLALLGFSDPSTRKLFVQHPDGDVTTVETPEVGICVHAGGELLRTSGYSWDPWNGVEWHERRKAGFGTVAEAMDELWQREHADG
jgi:hypothetical protein